MNNALKLVSMAALGIGATLIVLGLVQDLFGMEIFSEPPYLVGAGVAAVGAAMLAGFRKMGASSAAR